MELKIAFIFVACIAAGSDGSPAKETKGVKLELFHLGTVNGKRFYSESTTEMEWSKSKELCEQNGMQLATIETQAEYNFLKTIDDYDHFYNYYWTGARDAQSYRQYSWDHTNQEIGHFLQFEITGRPPLTCLAIVGAKNYWVVDRPCTQPSQTLCEKKE